MTEPQTKNHPALGPPLLGKEGSLLILIIVTLMLLGGCSKQMGSASNAVSEQNNSRRSATRVVTDDLGRKVTVPVRITRVVSTAPSVTENIFAVGAGDRLVGVTTFCNYPEEAKSIAKVGDTMNPNMETIVALKPDVVLVSSASQLENFTKVLEQNGIAVYVTNPTSLQGVFKNLKELGDLLGTREQAEKLVGDLVVRTLTESPSLPPKNNRVFIQISKEPLFTIGKDSFLNEVVGAAGGESVTEGVATAYPKLSKETASGLNPDVIILSDSPDNQEPNEAFRNSPAVKNGRVYKINADIISRPGPRLVDALEEIARDLHPEKFANK
ncbi:MAG: cobalamin-binding protein [Acidobacteria bacterium]|nr:cobalamin-binding protein [Acidobacteriota bacterium]